LPDPRNGAALMTPLELYAVVFAASLVILALDHYL
jgi:hypothetical protein